ncbi:hypothetical protein ACFE04_024837 [Oxalis oulophora]
MAEPRNGTLILCALPRQSYRGDMKNPWMKNPEILCKKVHLMEAIVDPLDLELNQLCDVIVEQLRDRIVTSLLQASLDGFVRVIFWQDGFFHLWRKVIQDSRFVLLVTEPLIPQHNLELGLASSTKGTEDEADAKTLLRFLNAAYTLDEVEERTKEL